MGKKNQMIPTRGMSGRFHKKNKTKNTKEQKAHTYKEPTVYSAVCWSKPDTPPPILAPSPAGSSPAPGWVRPMPPVRFTVAVSGLGGEFRGSIELSRERLERTEEAAGVSGLGEVPRVADGWEIRLMFGLLEDGGTMEGGIGVDVDDDGRAKLSS